MESLKEELTKSRNITILALICALVVVYGGTSISYGEATWFYVKYEFEADDGHDTELELEGFYTLEEIVAEGDITVNGTSEDLDDDANYKKDMEDVIDFTKNLALLSIILTIALLALIIGLLNGQFAKDKSEEYLEYAKKICLGLIVICLFNGGKFAVNFPEALEEDTDGQLFEDCGVEDNIPTVAMFLGGCTNKNTHQFIPGASGTFDGKWHPGPAWFITFAVIPGLAALEYLRFNDIRERGFLSQYEHISSRKSKNSISVPKNSISVPKNSISVPAVTQQAPVQTIPVTGRPKIQKKTGKSDKEKSKEKQVMVDVECPSCDAIMTVPKLDKMQEVNCNKCGLSGEIEI